MGGTWPERTWAVEGAGGLGHLLAQQLARRRRADPGHPAQARLPGPAAVRRASPVRTTPTTPARSPSPRCAPGPPAAVIADDHPLVLRYGPSGTGTWPGFAARPPAGCTPCSARWSRRRAQGHHRRSCGCRTARLADSGRAGAGRAARARRRVRPPDLRQIDGKLRDTRRKITAAVRASGTTLTEIFGVGPVIAATVLGDVPDITRFPGRDHFAAYNGTAPVEASSGKRKGFRLSRRGNRRMNHAIHMAAVTQVRNKHSNGRAYYDKKLSEGKTGKEALRALKRRVSDAVYARLQADARHAARATSAAGPGGQPGNDSASSAAGSHPARQLFGQATPGPRTRLRPAPPAAAANRPRKRP